jgi:hypothetical protein
MLDQILEKLGLRTFDELKPAERATYSEYARLLTLPDITIDDLKKFFAAENQRANAELRNFENGEKKQLYYQAYANFLTNIETFIYAPTKQREELRARLKQQFNIDS